MKHALKRGPRDADRNHGLTWIQQAAADIIKMIRTKGKWEEDKKN